MKKALSTFAVALPVAAGYYLYQVNRHISKVEASAISVADSSPASFRNSNSCGTVVNPRKYVGHNDSRSIVIELPPSKAAWSDEQILAGFVRGFFGGWVFTPERIVLQTVRRRLVGFSQIAKSEESEQIWSYRKLSDDRLPSLHSTLFGAFQLIDFHIRGQSSASDTDPVHSEESYVDFGFGSDQSSFAGVHRFSLSRSDSNTKKTKQSTAVVRITHSGLACNPSQNKLIKPQFLFTFHKFYAMLLFREGVAQVLRP